MARIFPKTYKAENNLIVSNEMNKQVFNHIEAINGGLDRESLPDIVLKKTTLSDSTATTVINTLVQNAINNWKAVVITSAASYAAEDLSKSYMPILSTTMDCTAGILAGALSINGYLVPYTGGDPEDMSRYRVAIFVDGTIVAETDNITEERHAFALPFSMTVTTKTITLEARLKVMTGVVTTATAFTVNAGQLWARNGKA